LCDQGASDIPLPVGWPDCARAAVIHVISLAHYAIACARGWAANSVNVRLRLAAKSDRLNQEVQLLREELRIKDARLAKIDPRRRPYYPPTERMAILELRAARAWSLAPAAKAFLVEPATVACWLKRIDEGGDAGGSLPRPPRRQRGAAHRAEAALAARGALCGAGGTRRRKHGQLFGRCTAQRSVVRFTMGQACCPRNGERLRCGHAELPSAWRCVSVRLHMRDASLPRAVRRPGLTADAPGGHGSCAWVAPVGDKQTRAQQLLPACGGQAGARPAQLTGPPERPS